MQQYCALEHPLQWTKKYISHCNLCGPVNTMARYTCPICIHYYCVKCVQPPVYGEVCGGGHPIKYIEILPHHSCDVCRQPIKGGGHRCQQCDYDVCENCWITKED